MQCFGKVSVMRKILITLLLASAAASPAIAGPGDNNDRQQAQEERQQARQERVQAREDARANRPAFNGQRVEQPRQNFAGQQQFNGNRYPQQANVDAMRAQRDARRDAMAAQRDERIEQVQQRFQQRQQDIRDARELRQSNRPIPQVMRDRHPIVVSDTPRFGTQPPLRADAQQRLQNMHWNHNWRNDQRYDWRHYRDRHRSRFHLSFYIDPFGWGYQPFSIGYRMWPSYYGNQYWIDPALYGLPYPPPGAAWVRYYNDVLLIDLYSGTVIDAIPGFFW